MQAETKDAIARTIATHIISVYANDIDALAISEMTYDDVEGLEPDLVGEIVKRVSNYIEVADVHISFPIHRVNRQTGELKTQEEIEAEFSAPLF